MTWRIWILANKEEVSSFSWIVTSSMRTEAWICTMLSGFVILFMETVKIASTGHYLVPVLAIHNHAGRTVPSSLRHAKKRQHLSAISAQIFLTGHETRTDETMSCKPS
ncbi:hypothetical protein VPH35_122623 [Triticum aestivum]